MSFKDRFRNRSETVARDGSNSFHDAQPANQHPRATRSQFSNGSNPPQQQHHQHHQQQQPPGASPSVYQSQYGDQGSFFMTGGGYQSMYGANNGAAVPPIATNPYGQLPPLANAPQPGSQQPSDHPYDQQQQQQQQHQYQHGNKPAKRAPFLTSVQASPSADDMSPGRTRRKEALPDFHELEVIHHGRRQGQVRDRAPVLVDHPSMGEYHQHSYGEYKQMLRDYGKQKWGGLGADDNSEKQREREKRRKMFDYANQVNAVNFAVMDISGEEWRNRPIERKIPEEAQIGQAKRNRAWRYADKVRPPAQSPRKNPPKANTPQPQTTVVDREIETLEEKHRRDQEAIMRIKAQLNMLADTNSSQASPNRS